MKEKFRPQSNLPLAWFLRPVNLKTNYCFAVCPCELQLFSDFHLPYDFSSFAVAGKMKLLPYQTLSAINNPYICFC